MISTRRARALRQRALRGSTEHEREAALRALASYGIAPENLAAEVERDELQAMLEDRLARHQQRARDAGRRTHETPDWFERFWSAFSGFADAASSFAASASEDMSRASAFTENMNRAAASADPLAGAEMAHVFDGVVELAEERGTMYAAAPVDPGMARGLRSSGRPVLCKREGGELFAAQVVAWREPLAAGVATVKLKRLTRSGSHMAHRTADGMWVVIVSYRAADFIRQQLRPVLLATPKARGLFYFLGYPVRVEYGARDRAGVFFNPYTPPPAP